MQDARTTFLVADFEFFHSELEAKSVESVEVGPTFNERFDLGDLNEYWAGVTRLSALFVSVSDI